MPPRPWGDGDRARAHHADFMRVYARSEGSCEAEVAGIAEMTLRTPNASSPRRNGPSLDSSRDYLHAMRRRLLICATEA